MEQSKSINVRYSMLQGIYYVGFCAVIGYAAVYLGSIGMSSSLIGIVLAIANILTSIAQPVLGGFVDKSNISMKKVLMIMFGLCSILSVFLMFVSKVTFLAAALFIAVSTILYTTMPLVNSLAFAFQKHGIDVKFGVARGIGSVAYALASLVLGNVVKAVSPTLMPLAYIVIFLGILPLIRSFKMPEAEIDEVIEEKVVEKESTGAFIKKHLKFMIGRGAPETAAERRVLRRGRDAPRLSMRKRLVGGRHNRPPTGSACVGRRDDAIALGLDGCGRFRCF